MDELGWADFQVRSDIAIRRHQALVNCAFCFCWDTWLAAAPPGRPRQTRKRGGTAPQSRQPRACQPVPPAPSWPRALRAVRSWLTPAITLTRWWQAWSKAPRPLTSSTCSTMSAQVTACFSTSHLDPTDYR